AAEAGDARGMFLLARCYLRGDGTSADAARAEHWMQKGAAAGDPDARRMQADRRLAAHPGDSRQYAESVRELEQSATDGSLEAAVRLVQVLAKNPNRSPDDLKKMNRVLSLMVSVEEPAEDTAPTADFEEVVKATEQLVVLTGQRNDPELS